MPDRLSLNAELQTVLGSKNVYFNPPESIKMNYPAIRYNLNRIDSRSANDKKYLKFKSYTVMVIDKNPDSNLPDAMLDYFEMIENSTNYVKDNLYHYVFTLYY